MLLTIQELSKAQCNNTDINNTDYSDTDPFLSVSDGIGHDMKSPSWKRSLSILFIGAAEKLFYKYKNHEEKPYLYVGIVLMIGFGITG